LFTGGGSGTDAISLGTFSGNPHQLFLLSRKQMTELYVLISYESDPTFFVGIFPSIYDAENYATSDVRRQVGFAGLADDFRQQFGVSLTDMTPTQLRNALFANDNDDQSDWIGDDLHLSINQTNAGVLFNFTQFHSWNAENLYEGLQMILQGQTGVLEWPFAEGRALLREFDRLVYRQDDVLSNPPIVYNPSSIGGLPTFTPPIPQRQLSFEDATRLLQSGEVVRFIVDPDNQDDVPTGHTRVTLITIDGTERDVITRYDPVTNQIFPPAV